MISKNENKKGIPPERVTHFGSIPIDDGVVLHSGAYADSHHRMLVLCCGYGRCDGP